MFKFIQIALLVLMSFDLVKSINIIDIPLENSKNDTELSDISEEIANIFAEEYIEFRKTNIESRGLKQILQKLSTIQTKQKLLSINPAEWLFSDEFFLCTTCRSAVTVIGRMFRSDDGEFNNMNDDEIKDVALDLCDRLNIQTQTVCSGIFDLYWPIVHHVILNTTADSRSICGMLPISFCSIHQIYFDWSIDIDNTEANTTEQFLESTVQPVSSNNITIIHISDIHYDPYYIEGSLANCEEPLCCREIKKNITEEEKAGKWGDYRYCDSPLHMIESALESIKQQYPNVNYIYLTGDVVPHNIWSTTIEYNKQIIKDVYDLLHKNFKTIRFYPTVGNHETHPANVFANENVPDEFNVTWLYSYLWYHWQRWLPQSVKETVLQGGYYTIKDRAGLRIIVLNNNDCYIQNWWIYYNGREAGLPQMQWLHDILLKAEEANESVHILGHLPSGGLDCWNVWAREFNRLIERFKHIIGGIFNGHTHKDEMNVHYTSDGQAMAISWNAGSLTPYSYTNPNYKAYTVETNKYRVIEAESWTFNLTEANQVNRVPRWYKQYSFTDFTDDLSPKGIDIWLDELSSTPNILRKFWEYKMASSDPRVMEGCDKECLLTTICKLATTVNNQKERCKELQEKLLLSLEAEATTTEIPTNNTTTVIPPTNTTDNNVNNGAATVTAVSKIAVFALLANILLFSKVM